MLFDSITNLHETTRVEKLQRVDRLAHCCANLAFQTTDLGLDLVVFGDLYKWPINMSVRRWSNYFNIFE